MQNMIMLNFVIAIVVESYMKVKEKTRERARAGLQRAELKTGVSAMPSSFGLHRMPSPCARGATASGGVTLVFDFDTEYVLHRLLALHLGTNFHVSFAIAVPTPTHANEKVLSVARPPVSLSSTHIHTNLILVSLVP